MHRIVMEEREDPDRVDGRGIQRGQRFVLRELFLNNKVRPVFVEQLVRILRGHIVGIEKADVVSLPGADGRFGDHAAMPGNARRRLRTGQKAQLVVIENARDALDHRNGTPNVRKQQVVKAFVLQRLGEYEIVIVGDDAPEPQIVRDIPGIRMLVQVLFRVGEQPEEILLRRAHFEPAPVGAYDAGVIPVQRRGRRDPGGVPAGVPCEAPGQQHGLRLYIKLIVQRAQLTPHRPEPPLADRRSPSRAPRTAACC